MLAALRRRRQHWQRCQQIVDALPSVGAYGVDELCSYISRRRGRRLRVLEEPALVGEGLPTGAWLATVSEDLIFVVPGATVTHREHVILHELGHMLLDHRDTGGSTMELARALMPGVTPALARKMLLLTRTTYDAPQEEEAEIFATVAGSRWSSRAGIRCAHRQAEGALERLAHALGPGQER